MVCMLEINSLGVISILYFFETDYQVPTVVY